MCKGNVEQPLFESCCAATTEKGTEGAPDDMRHASKSLVKKLYDLRRGLDPTEQLYVAQINSCIEAIRDLSRYTDSKREELVLYAIEKSQATTPTEIAEDTRLDLSIVKNILQDLHARDIVYQVRRYIPGSDRQYFILKSRRVENVEAHVELFAVTRNDIYSDIAWHAA